jgi:hypothetical protein
VETTFTRLIGVSVLFSHQVPLLVYISAQQLVPQVLRSVFFVVRPTVDFARSGAQRETEPLLIFAVVLAVGATVVGHGITHIRHKSRNFVAK